VTVNLPSNRRLHDVDEPLLLFERLFSGCPPRNPCVVGLKAYEGRVNAILARAGIFQGVEPSAVSALIKQLRPVDFPRGHTIFAEGEPGDRLYIIVSGKVKIARRSPGWPREPAHHHGATGHIRERLAHRAG
jgi:hypothetical protein